MAKKVFLLGIFLAIIYFLLTTFQYWQFLTKTLKISPIKTLLSLDSIKTYADQVNILILGMAGRNHEGSTLTDLIVVFNYNLQTNSLITISVPRDIWSDTLQDKINSAYAYGAAKEKNGGLKLAKAEVGAIVGFPIHYAMLIDFANFAKLIDSLGGLEIEIKRGFTDHKFPIPGKENDQCEGDQEFKCRYETISFSQGVHKMNGETALKFVRSRNAIGAEGSDFARNNRQALVITALKSKFEKIIFKPNLSKWARLYQILDESLQRDINNQKLSIILKKLIFAKDKSQTRIILTRDFFDLNHNFSSKGQYILIPKNNDFRSIHQYIRLKQKGKK